MKPTAKVPLRPDRLLGDIASLEARFRKALEDRCRIDRVRGFGGKNNPYDDFAPALARLFESARRAFSQQKMALARDAYAALFALLVLKDDYGFAVTRPEHVVISDEQTRYLRALGETAAPGERSVLLLQTMRRLGRSLWERCNLTIQSVLEITPLPQGEREEWLEGLIDHLSQDRERDADRWLREAVKLRSGGDGLQELARRENPWRPRAWLDWLETVSAQADHGRLLAAAKEALANIPEGLELRAMAADHLSRAALALGDQECLLVARWEAFRAEPFPTRLLDLRAAAPDAEQQRTWMRRVVTSACDQAGGSIQGPRVDGFGNNQEVLFKENGDCFASGPTNGTVACALMLAGDWRKAFRMARDEPYENWVGTATVRMAVLPVIMAWLAEWPKPEPPTGVSELLADALGLFDVHGKPGLGVAERLRAVLVQSIPAWKPVPAAVGAAVVDDCVRLARIGVAGLLQRAQHSRSNRAALLAAAAAEVLRARRSDADAVRFLDGLAVKHRKHSEFIQELTVRRR